MAYSDRGIAVGGSLAKEVLCETERAWSDFTRSPRVKTTKYAEHDVIFYQGDTAERMYELAEGAIMLYKLLPDGRRQVVEVLGPNNLFGMPSGKLHDCNAETLTPCVVRVVERKETESSVAIQRHITSCLLSQMETLHDHAMLLGRKSAFERVASFLMRFVPGRGQTDCPGPRAGGKDESVVYLSMTRQEIADYLGLTIETVSRVISDLKRRGLIAIEKQDRIRINNICGICHLSGTH